MLATDQSDREEEEEEYKKPQHRAFRFPSNLSEIGGNVTQPTLDVLSIESDIFFKLGRGGCGGCFSNGDGFELDANVAGEARNCLGVVFGQVDDVYRVLLLGFFELEEDGEDRRAGFRGRERGGVDGDVCSFVFRF